MNLYDNLMRIAHPDNPVGFYYVDQVTKEGTPVRIFGYHFASYSDWLNEDAIEARGIMFNMSVTPPKLMCLPMHKFFNLGENPFTENIKINESLTATNKEDGSLISFFMDNGKLYAKSRMSVHSSQAEAANALIKTDKFSSLYKMIKELCHLGFTVNCEYVAPDNRVVLEYTEPDIIVLNVRDNISREYLSRDKLEKYFGEHLVQKIDIQSVAGSADVTSFIPNIRKMTGIEGVVCQQDGLWFKVKTEWYSALHKTKDNMSSPTKILIAIAEECYDDLYSLAGEHEKNRLDKALAIYKDYLSSSIFLIKYHHNIMNGTSRKDYALYGRDIFDSSLFSVYMKMYSHDVIEMDDLMELLKQAFIKNVDTFADKL